MAFSTTAQTCCAVRNAVKKRRLRWGCALPVLAPELESLYFRLPLHKFLYIRDFIFSGRPYNNNPAAFLQCSLLYNTLPVYCTRRRHMKLFLAEINHFCRLSFKKFRLRRQPLYLVSFSTKIHRLFLLGDHFGGWNLKKSPVAPIILLRRSFSQVESFQTFPAPIDHFTGRSFYWVSTVQSIFKSLWVLWSCYKMDAMLLLAFWSSFYRYSWI